jgi:hypothetical protein
MMSPFVVLLVDAGICPPVGSVDLCGRVVRQSCWACAWYPDWGALNRSCTRHANLSNTDVWGTPQTGYCGIPNGYGDMLHIWFGTYGGGMYVYWYGTDGYGGGGVHASILGLNWTLWPPVLSDSSGGPIGLTCCRSWVGERGHFGGRSLGSAFFFTDFDYNWSKVGPDFTSRPTTFNVLFFHVPISGRRGLKVCGCRGSWALPYLLLESSELSDDVPDRPRLCAEPPAMRRTGTHA